MGIHTRAMKLQARFWEMLQEGNEYKVSCRHAISRYTPFEAMRSNLINASYSEEKKEICFHKKGDPK